MGSRRRTLQGALRRVLLRGALTAAALSAGMLLLLSGLANIADVLHVNGWLGVLLLAATVSLSVAVATLAAWYLSRRLLGEITAPLRSLSRVAATDDLDALGSNVNALIDELENYHAHAQGEHTRQASLDHLTGLPNRAFFEGRLARNLSGIDKRRERLAVLHIDADHFAALNDRHGYSAADEVLISLAGRIRAQLGENDLLARLGGDAFAVLLCLEQDDHARQLADHIIASTYVPFVLPSADTVNVSVSVGVARFPEQGTTPAELLAAAHAALLQAKRQGRGRWFQAQSPAHALPAGK